MIWIIISHHAMGRYGTKLKWHDQSKGQQ